MLLRVWWGNYFIFHFQSDVDKIRVLRTEPGHFNNFLKALVEPQGMRDVSKIRFTKAPFWSKFIIFPSFVWIKKKASFWEH